MKKKQSPSRLRGGFYFTLPAVIILGGFGLLVTLENIGYSFLKWTALSPPTFIGLKNYVRFFTDKIALISLWNTFYYAILYVFPTIVISTIIALLLNQSSRIMEFFRALFYIPVITSYVIVIVVWQWIFDYDIGLFNQILAQLGRDPLPLVAQQKHGNAISCFALHLEKQRLFHNLSFLLDFRQLIQV